MTCIVTYKDNDGRIFMAGDRMGGNTARYETSQIANPKVFYKSLTIDQGSHGSRVGKMMIGYTSSFRLGQLLEYKFKAPKYDCGDSPISYMIEKFVPKVIDLYDENYYGKKSDAEKMNGGIILVAFKQKMFKIQNDFAVLEFTDNFMSCGCGSDYALAAMHIMHEDGNWGGESTVRRAILTAAKFSAYVDDTVDVLSLP